MIVAAFVSTANALAVAVRGQPAHPMADSFSNLCPDGRQNESCSISVEEQRKRAIAIHTVSPPARSSCRTLLSLAVPVTDWN